MNKRRLAIGFWIRSRLFASIRGLYSSFTFLATFIFLISIEISADELLRSIGMGGVRIASRTDDSTLFGNPANLIAISDNNLSTHFSVENFQIESPPLENQILISNQLDFQTSPSISFSRKIKNYGFAFGVATHFKTELTIAIEGTTSEYLVDQQRFIATTPSWIDYDTVSQKSWQIGLARKFGESRIGVRIKRHAQNVRRGRVLTTLNLDSQHPPDVNINDPRALIPAIIDSIDLADPGKYVDRDREILQNLTINKFDFDIGYQRDFRPPNVCRYIWFGDRILRFGVLIENVLQRKFVDPLPLEIGVGASSEIFDWLEIATDLSRVSGQKGLNFAIGWELRKSWRRGFRGAIALRNGFSRIDGDGHFSFGLAIGLASSKWEYAVQKRFRDQPLSNAIHFVSSTVKF